MRIISKAPLADYGVKRPDARQPLQAWYDETRRATWKTPQDIKDAYGNASFVGQNRVVFNIKGNSHRLVVAVAYRINAVYIKFIGSHAEYDKIDASTIEME